MNWHLPKNRFYLFQRKPLMNMIFFILKALFVVTFLAIYENGLIRKLWQISKATSHIGIQTITINILPDILPDISKSKNNKTIKLGQYKKRNIFFKNNWKNEGESTDLRVPLIISPWLFTENDFTFQLFSFSKV